MTYHTALDVSLRSVSICIVDDEGTIHFEAGALNIDEWYAARTGKTQANFGTTVGQELARMRVHDGLKLEGPDISMPYFFDYRDTIFFSGTWIDSGFIDHNISFPDYLTYCFACFN